MRHAPFFPHGKGATNSFARSFVRWAQVSPKCVASCLLMGSKQVKTPAYGILYGIQSAYPRMYYSTHFIYILSIICMNFVGQATCNSPPSALIHCINISAQSCPRLHSDFECLCNMKMEVLQCLESEYTGETLEKARNHYFETCTEFVPHLIDDSDYDFSETSDEFDIDAMSVNGFVLSAPKGSSNLPKSSVSTQQSFKRTNEDAFKVSTEKRQQSVSQHSKNVAESTKSPNIFIFEFATPVTGRKV